MIGEDGLISNSNRTGPQAQWRENRVTGRPMVASTHNNKPKIMLEKIRTLRLTVF